MGASIGGVSQPIGSAGSNEDFLKSQYQNTLGREADPEGYNYWLGQLNNGVSRDVITQGFMGSDEYKNRAAAGQPGIMTKPFPAPTSTDANGASYYQQPTQQAVNPGQFDNQLQGFYKQYLGREADQPGLDYWRESLASGRNTLDDVRNAFTGSDEYKAIQSKKQADLMAAQNKQFNPYGTNPFANSQNPYFQAAQQNAAGNLAGAQMATAANRVNQTTPYQSLQFTQSGVDAQGNPIWNANQQLAPGFQQSLDNIKQNVQQATARPFDVSATQNKQFTGQSPEFQRMGETPTLQSSVEGTGMAGWDRANELLMSRLRPQMEQRRAALDAKLANQGIMPGTEAYNRVMLTSNQADNDLMNQAQLAGQQVQNTQFNQNLQGGQFRNQALAAQNQMGLANAGFNNAAGQQGFTNQLAGAQFNNQANQNNFQQNLSAYNNPLQQLAAFQQGTNPSYANVANQQGVAGPDYFGALTTSNAADIAAQNARNAQTANMQAGLFGLGSSALLGGGGIGGLANTIGSGVNWLTGLGGGSSADYMRSIGAVSSGAFDPAMQSADYLNNLYGLDIF